MGLLDREYMRETPRLHVGEVRVDSGGELNATDVLRQQQAAEQQQQAAQQRGRQWRQKHWRDRRRYAALALAVIAIVSLATSGIVGLQRTTAGGYALGTCAPWPTCFHPLALEQSGARFVGGAWSNLLHQAGLGPLARRAVTYSGARRVFIAAGVHVCAASRHSSVHLTCAADLPRLSASHLADVYLSVTGRHGGVFDRSRLWVVVSRAAVGRHPAYQRGFWVDLGAAIRRGIKPGVWGPSLSQVARQGHSDLRLPGAYVISARDARSLGYTTFRVVR